MGSAGRKDAVFSNSDEVPMEGGRPSVSAAGGLEVVNVQKQGYSIGTSLFHI